MSHGHSHVSSRFDLVRQTRAHSRTFGPFHNRGALALFARQFASPVIWLLVGASVLSAALGELLDAGAIGAIAW